MAAPPLRLPTNHPIGINPYDISAQPAWHIAYNQCLKLQIGDSQQQLYARCLGYLLQEAIDETSRDYVAAEIIRCKYDAQKLNDLAKFYILHIFCLCELVEGCRLLQSYTGCRFRALTGTGYILLERRYTGR